MSTNTAETTENYFGSYLQHKREYKRITLRQLAKELNVSAPFLSDVEKGRRNSLDIKKLRKLKDILELDDEQYHQLLDLAGKQRHTVAPDLPEYIIDRDYVSAAIREARDLDAGEDEWRKFVEELRSRKGNS